MQVEASKQIKGKGDRAVAANIIGTSRPRRQTASLIEPVL